MASLKGVIVELDIINEKIDRMVASLAKAREDIDYVLTRAAELPLERNTDTPAACVHARAFRLPSGRLFCPKCDDYV